MQVVKRLQKVIVITAAGFLGLRSIFGYIDPSSGGMLFQILAVAFGLISGLLLFFSSRIKMGLARLMRRIRGQGEEVEVLEEGEASEQ